MISEKKGILDIVEICAQHGISKVVLSPGSRNAPLIIAFNQHPQFECFCIPDERVAAFVALGMAQQSGMPVIIACTSGTAALNYAPAIAEAFHQNVPLLVMTADRPVEWIGQADGQTINQNDLYHNYIRKSFQFPQEPYDNDMHWFANRQMNEAIGIAQAEHGPVHLNLPFREPLYGEIPTEKRTPKVIRRAIPEPQLAPELWKELFATWNTTKKVMILVGKHAPDSELTVLLRRFAEGKAIILTETTANLHYPKFISCIDRTIFGIEKSVPEDFKPDLLITLGDAVISKKIKTLLRNWQPTEHWHIHPLSDFPDTFQSLTRCLPVSSAAFFREVSQHTELGPVSDYAERWQALSAQAKERHTAFVPTAPWSDFAAFGEISKHLPTNSDLQLSNSTPVRYVQLFDQKEHVHHFANRGTSGIDGCSSTAVGAALQTEKLTTLITGDVAFFYDSNAFWHPYLPAHLKIILIHNSGGGIFRIIDGPSSTQELEGFFESRHTTSSEQIAKAHGLAWKSCCKQADLAADLNWLYATKGAAILEIQTPPEANDQVLKAYIQSIKQ